jgi:hypothetical protein
MAANLSSSFSDLQIEDSNMDVDDTADTNPSPHNKSTPTEQPAQATGDLETHFTDAASARAFALVQADKYLSSFPGWSNAANNTTLHNSLRRLHNHNEHMSMVEIEGILGQLKFRLDLADRATWLLETADIPFPEGLRCDEFNERAFMMCKLGNPQSDASKKYDLAVTKIFRKILPDPVVSKQGFRWNKPHHYIAAAIAMDARIKNKEQLDNAVRRLEQGLSAPSLFATTD